MKKRILIGSSCVLVLISAIGAQFYQALFYVPVLTNEAPLNDTILTEIEGWTSEEIPLAETQEVKAAVSKQLNFDDAFSRIYKRGNTQVLVYVAYWEPLKMPVRSVSAHTPDICWIRNGWSRKDRKTGIPLTVNTTAIKPAEYGLYELHGNLSYVYFWHIVGGDLFVAKNPLGVHDRMQYLTDFFEFGINQRKEQYFVRISCNIPFENIWSDPGIQALLLSISRNSGLELDLESSEGS